MGYQLMGFVDDDSSKFEEFRNTGYSIVADLREFPDFVRDHGVDEILIGLPLQSHYQQASQIVASCEEQGIMVRILSDLFDLKLAHSKMEHLDGESIITIHREYRGGPRFFSNALSTLSFPVAYYPFLTPFLDHRSTD